MEDNEENAHNLAAPLRLFIPGMTATPRDQTDEGGVL